MPSPGPNHLVLAAAGSRKTQRIVESALAVKGGRVLIVTYTNENQAQIVRRIQSIAGVMPANVDVMGWFAFLIRDLIRPYQRTVLGKPNMVAGLNFKGQRNRFTKKTQPSYFLDAQAHLYRDGVSDLATVIAANTKGASISRLENVYTHIFVDEVQDLVGYDLDVLDLLISSKSETMFVGDPRQFTLRTNVGPRNKAYTGVDQVKWFEKRKPLVQIEVATDCYRSNQAICNFADSIFPEMPRTSSKMADVTGHDGVVAVRAAEVAHYVSQYRPVVLRWDKGADTQMLPAMNIGVAKGSTFDRTLIFPTKPMLTFLEDGDVTKLKAPEKLYVASTRARYSTAFVVPDKAALAIPYYKPGDQANHETAN